MHPTNQHAGSARIVRGGADLHVGLIGCGRQGRNLIGAILRLGGDSGARIRAVCDLWPQALQTVTHELEPLARHGHLARPYGDWREMLNREDLDAVFIATPDFAHADQALAALENGCHVYCEAPISNRVEDAKRMVAAAERSSRILQVGHQRRSNPVYNYVRRVLLEECSALGRITHLAGQCHRSRLDGDERGWPRTAEIDSAVLKDAGYESMHELVNWRWRCRLATGPFATLGGGQIDTFRWLLGDVRTAQVQACGQSRRRGNEWPDNAVALLAFETPSGTVRLRYDVLTSNSSMGHYEQILGDHGSLQLSESPGRDAIYREAWYDLGNWQPWVETGVVLDTEGHHDDTPDPTNPDEVDHPPFWWHDLEQALFRIPAATPAWRLKKKAGVKDVRATTPAPRYTIPVRLTVQPYVPHVKNFIAAVRGERAPTCPTVAAIETLRVILEANRAMDGTA